MKNNVFKKSSMERIASPEKLDDFIKVSNPSSWMVLGAALALLLGLLVWGIFGQLSQSVTFNGHLKDDHLYCYASGNLAEQLTPGMNVSIAVQGAESLSGRILSVAEHPLSFDEAARDITSDYLLSSLGITGWNIIVIIETDAPLYEGVVYTVSAVTDTFRPIEMVFR